MYDLNYLFNTFYNQIKISLYRSNQILWQSLDISFSKYNELIFYHSPENHRNYL